MNRKTKFLLSLVTLLAFLAAACQPMPDQPLADLPLLTPAPQSEAVPAQEAVPQTPEQPSAPQAAQEPEALVENSGQGDPEDLSGPATAPDAAEAPISEDGVYDSKEDVALYLHTYGRLPSNYITKKEARELGWEGGSVEDYAPGMCIGGDRFGNYEGILPEGDYTECDIDTLGKGSRGAKRLVFSEDGRIYYTGDHYESFEQLY